MGQKKKKKPIFLISLFCSGNIYGYFCYPLIQMYKHSKNSL